MLLSDILGRFRTFLFGLQKIGLEFYMGLTCSPDEILIKLLGRDLVIIQACHVSLIIWNLNQQERERDGITGYHINSPTATRVWLMLTRVGVIVPVRSDFEGLAVGWREFRLRHLFKSYIFDFLATSCTFSFVSKFLGILVFLRDSIHIPALSTTHRTFW